MIYKKIDVIWLQTHIKQVYLDAVCVWEASAWTYLSGKYNSN